MMAIAVALLIQPADLSKLADAFVVDARPAAQYQAGHIPGAVNLDAESLSEDRGGVNGLVKPVDAVRTLFEKAGLSPDKHVVVYSASARSVNDIRPATRLFWVLEYHGFPRVSVLDGGFEAWKAEGLEVQTDTVTPTPTSLPELKTREELRATADEVESGMTDGAVVLLDCRSPEEYAGTKKGAGAKAGHIPGAHSVPASTLVSADRNRFASVADIDKRMREKGLEPDAAAYPYCNTGRQASVDYFALRLAGHEKVALYDGSMSEWTSEADRPVEQGSHE